MANPASIDKMVNMENWWRDNMPLDDTPRRRYARVHKTWDLGIQDPKEGFAM